jgi:hypothetical protein
MALEYRKLGKDGPSVALGVWMLALMMPSLVAVVALPWIAPALERALARLGGPRAGTLVMAAALAASAALGPGS